LNVQSLNHVTTGAKGRRTRGDKRSALANSFSWASNNF
jgi:hypothetical protein